jgi:hypothetical protein
LRPSLDTSADSLIVHVDSATLLHILIVNIPSKVRWGLRNAVVDKVVIVGAWVWKQRPDLNVQLFGFFIPTNKAVKPEENRVPSGFRLKLPQRLFLPTGRSIEPSCSEPTDFF